MMKKLLQLVYMCAALLTTTILTHTGCKKPTDNPPTGNNTPTPTPCDTCLPPIATEGNSMFGCRVNGKVWLPKDSWMSPALRLELYNPVYSNIIGLIARDHSVTGFPQGFSIFIAPITDTGFIVFDKHSLEYSWSRFYNPDEFESEPIQKGFIHFKKVDRIKGSVAGTFEFDVYSRDLQDTIHITDGRFLIHK
jgi:hypothetical protein